MALPLVPLNPQDVFLTRSLARVLARLDRWRDQGGVFLLTGEAGCGKTSAIRLFLHRLHAPSEHALCLPLPLPSVRALYRALLAGLGELPQGLVTDLAARYQLAVRSLTRDGTRLFVVLDEAQELPLPVLAHLRALLTTSAGEPLPVGLLLSGTPECTRHLRLATLRPLEQRIVGTAHLTALGRDELPAYVDHLLAQAHTTLPLSPESYDELFHQTRGIPRLVTGVLRLWLDQPDPCHPDALVQALREAGFTPTSEVSSGGVSR